MIERDHHVEVLAQALWRKMFGEKRILSTWTEYAQANPDVAKTLRDKASDMLSVHEGWVGNGQSRGRSAHHSGLGWLY